MQKLESASTGLESLFLLTAPKLSPAAPGPLNLSLLTNPKLDSGLSSFSGLGSLNDILNEFKQLNGSVDQTLQQLLGSMPTFNAGPGNVFLLNGTGGASQGRSSGQINTPNGAATFSVIGNPQDQFQIWVGPANGPIPTGNVQLTNGEGTITQAPNGNYEFKGTINTDHGPASFDVNFPSGTVPTVSITPTPNLASFA